MCMILTGLSEEEMDFLFVLQRHAMQRRRPVHDFLLTSQPYYRKTRRLRRQLLLGLLVLTAAVLPVGLAILIAAAKD